MRQRTKHLAGVSNADLAATEAAISAVSGKFAGMFSVALIAEGDPDNIDENGVYTGTPRYWATSVKLKPSERSALQDALIGPDGESPIIPSLHYQVVDSKKPDKDEDLIDAWAARYGLRRPGHIIEAYGTAKASGAFAAQSLTTDPALLSQWTSVVDLINMGSTGQRFEIITPGDYYLQVRLWYDDQAIARNETVWAKAAVGSSTVGGEATGVGGALEASKALPGLDAGTPVGIAVYSSALGSALKLTSGSAMRLKRIA